MDNNVEVGKEGRKDEDGRRIFGKTKLKLQAALEMILGDIFCESHLNDGEDEHSDCSIFIRVYIRREFRSLRSDSHTICDSKHSIC